MKISRVLVTVAALLCAGAAQAQVNDQAGLNACWQDYGTDEASIAANFGESQLCNFQNNSNLDATISGIPSPTLAMIVNQINATSGANPGVA
ncbi:hypothetical protein, partial [Bradyrhizobium sp.]|uniref:hypothetical protein n=1 Tax=Bradyrhizobium sp. TaxID=376 RepID=UPI003C3A8547